MPKVVVFICAVLLASCSSVAPKPETLPSESASSVQPPVTTEPNAAAATSAKDTIRDSVFIREPEDLRNLQNNIDSMILAGETENAIELLKKQVQYYNNLDNLGFRTLQLANLLYKNGRAAEALAILESFAVYKPAINAWIDSANSLYEKISGSEGGGNFGVLKNAYVGGTAELDPETQEAINSLAAQIRNLKNANANPIFIEELVDSLKSLSAGDSVVAWAENQIPNKQNSIDSFCEEQRKIAADKFAASRRNRSKANALLDEAIEMLDKCLDQKPSNEMEKKVRQNKDVLIKEKGGEN